MHKYFLQLKKQNYQRGQALLISLVFFTSISLAVTTGLVVPTVKEFKISNTSLKSKQSYVLAESGLEDAYLRLLGALAFT
jgi:Tfp pilus assembly protein PilX